MAAPIPAAVPNYDAVFKSAIAIHSLTLALKSPRISRSSPLLISTKVVPISLFPPPPPPPPPPPTTPQPTNKKPNTQTKTNHTTTTTTPKPPPHHPTHHTPPP